MTKRRIMVLILGLVMAMASVSFASAAQESTIKFSETKPALSKVASYSYNKVKLTWEKVYGATGYEIYRATSKSGKYKKVGNAEKDRRTYINGSLTTGKKYYYKIRAFKKTKGKVIFSKYSAILSTTPKPSKVKMYEVYGRAGGFGTANIDWKAVSGVTGYEQQVNVKKDGKWSGWKSYTLDESSNRNEFTNYTKLLALNKKIHPNGIEVYVKEKDDFVKMTPAQYAEYACPKTYAWIDIVEDDTVYNFRVRAYRTVNGKRIYGPWSDGLKLKENLDLEKLRKDMADYQVNYATKYRPEWEYIGYDDEELFNQMQRDTITYNMNGIFGGFSKYAKQEDVKAWLESETSSYIEHMGATSGHLFIYKVKPGEKYDAFGVNDTDKTFYHVLMLQIQTKVSNENNSRSIK